MIMRGRRRRQHLGFGERVDDAFVTAFVALYADGQPGMTAAGANSWMRAPLEPGRICGVTCM